MDEELKKLLDKWKIPVEYKLKLEDQYIYSTDVLLMMSESDIASIFDKMGPRLLFQNNLNRTLKERDSALCEAVVNVEEHSSLQKPPTLLDVNANKTDTQEDVSCPTEHSSSFQLNTTQIHAQPTPPVAPSHSTMPRTAPMKRPVSSAAPDSVLKKLCLSCFNGKVVLNYFQEKQELDDDHRNMLADVILNDYMKDDVQRKLPHEVEASLSRQVVELFPSEVKEMWMASTPGGRNKSVGRGILIKRYYLQRRKAGKGGLFKKQAAVTDRSSETRHMAHRINFQEDPDDVDDELEEAIYNENEMWLCNNKNPWSQLFSTWKETSKRRLRNLVGGNVSVHEYLMKFPALQDSSGYLLLEADFEYLYEGKSMCLFAEWPSLSAFVESRALKPVLDEIQTSLTPDGKKVRTLQALGCLFNVVTTAKKGKGKQWRPSRQEVGESILLHVKTMGDINPTLVLRFQEKYEPFGLHLAPQAIVVGSSMDSVEKCYVRVNNEVLFEVENPLKAVDIAFKIMHAMDCQYPKESEREWFFLETCVYGMNLHKKNPLRPKIAATIKDYDSYKMSA